MSFAPKDEPGPFFPSYLFGATRFLTPVVLKKATCTGALVTRSINDTPLVGRNDDFSFATRHKFHGETLGRWVKDYARVKPVLQPRRRRPGGHMRSAQPFCSPAMPALCRD